ncbi:MAG: NADAR family protein [Alphaproteobacteria bacterium]|nr:NADAR family protein [Alphaproteobacteria bacterium]
MVSDKILNFTDNSTRFLSNFYPYKKDGGKYPHKVRVFYNNIEFDCVENAYQAAKFTNKQKQIAFSKLSPYETKAYWEDKTDYRADWHQVKLQIMEDLVRQKFCNSKELKEMLLDTGNQILEEGNDWGDTFWGVCNGVGENNLGKILMKIRTELKNFINILL